MDRVKIKINGREIEVEKSKTILQVAKELGYDIPTLCYNEKVSHNTSCFVCVVRDKRSGKYIPSCSAYVEDGMDIVVDEPDVIDMRKTALNLLLSEHTGDCEAPCTLACPAHARVEEYVRACKDGKFLEALKIIKERIPLPISISRVCPRFCEKDCRRNVIDGEPVAINDFKRLAADLYYDKYLEELPPLNGKKVAIVGAGPAGISVAYFLRLNGIASDVFDKMPEVGGMLRYGIPEYRLPKALLDKELEHFEKMGGIAFLCGKELGKDISLKELTEKYDAVAITVGSWKPSPMRVEGEELAEKGIDWLARIALNGWKGENPGKTIVIGGGNTAMDCVRTALRLKSKEVYCFYRRTENEMPAEKIEIEEAKEEGVKFQFLVAPVKLEEKDGRKVLTCQRMKLGEPDASGRRRPVPIPGSEFKVEADTVIAAIGQKTIAPEGIKTNRWGDIEVDKDNYQVEGKIFAAGDCVTGPATVVEAVAAGRKVALGIISFLDGSKYKESYSINVTRGHWQFLKKEDLVFLKDPVERKRQKNHYIPLEERISTFKEVTETFTPEEIHAEGERCLECSCTAKHDCKLKQLAEAYGASPEAIKGEKLKFDYDNRHPEIILDRNKCIKCGICIKVCKEVVNQSLLGFVNRGYSTTISTAFKEPLPLSCKDCGKCIEECPVGALDWKIKS
ncbi:MAG: FAD-dependent oxidoreductase [Candidatus Marinimicrobia bacterium]|nr:FAD-dependent oxidoreductase [Candidatus Neomarinimicrobiota bacterium]